MAGATTISVKMAKAIAAEINGLDRLFVDMNTYLPLVRADLDQILKLKKRSPTRHALRSLLFALASPQNRFDSNVVVARKLHGRLSELDSVDTICRLLMEDKCGTVSSGGVARAIFHSLDYIRNVGHFDAVTLRQKQSQGILMGGGMKVTAMAAHLYDPNDRCFTLDTHMLRGIVRTVLGLEGTWSVSGTAYSILENALLEWSDSRYGAEYPFVIQWTMWCVFRGTFDSHVAIFN